MKYLTKLSPAETLIVLQDKNAVIQELLKVTFMDLLVKQVLRTFEVERRASSKEPVRTTRYVEAGTNFATYQALPHETVFLTAFQKSTDMQMLFRNVVKMGYQNAKSQVSYQSGLIKGANIKNFFKKNFFQIFSGEFSITSACLQIRKEIQSEMATVEKQLTLFMKNDHQKALHILKQINGNIFLMKNIEFELLKQIDKELLAEMNKQDSRGTSSGCSGCAWVSFDNYSDSFDSSCSGTSGCGGASGCSGCSSSGCSGCGGCGGGD